MEAYIKGVAVYNNSDKPCFVKLSTGLNIITGASKKGKSAILKIIDWCFGSNDFIIPKGVITDFAEIYSIIITTPINDVIIARKGEHYSNLMFVKSVSHRTVESITYDFFAENEFVTKKQAFDKLETIFNFKIDDGLYQIQFEEPTGKANIRNLIPFMLQPQRIVANDFELFYENPTPSYFPVLAGWIGQEYYNVTDELRKLANEIPKIENEIKAIEEENYILEDNFRDVFRRYYDLVGEYFNDNWDISTLLKKMENFPKTKYNKNISNNIYKRQQDIEAEINKYNGYVAEKNIYLNKLQNHKTTGGEYSFFLEQYQRRKDYTKNKETYLCPICKSPNFELTVEAEKIKEAELWLEKELSTIPKTIEKFDVVIENIKAEQTEIRKHVKKLRDEFTKNDEILTEIIKTKPVDEEIHNAKLAVEQEAKFMNRKKRKADYKKLTEKKGREKTLIEIKSTFQITEKYEEAKVMIEKSMNEIVDKLDFEFQPANLCIELNHNKKSDLYNLYHNIEGKEKRYLKQIGSASNSLACHIGLFLSFLKYFATRNSRVPTILFFDQPSQVYFPSGTKNKEKDKDTQRVAEIYQTIIDIINEIFKETKFKPQVIVADHIKDLGNHVELLEDYFKADWREENDGFITIGSRP